jgi:hypothetical protein
MSLIKYSELRKTGVFRSRAELTAAILEIVSKTPNTTNLNISKQVEVSTSTVRRIRLGDKATYKLPVPKAPPAESPTMVATKYWPAPDLSASKEYFESIGIYYIP